MSVVFAVLCALVWGTADYLGGKASRRAESSVVTLFGQGAGLLAALLVIPIVGDRVPPPADWGYGFLAGAFGAVALLCLYRALATGAMTVVAPIAGVTSAIVPAVWGLAAGDRPSSLALAGLGVAVVSIALVSWGGARSANPGEQHTPVSVRVLALVAGLGFGSLSVALSYTSGEGGLWAVVAMKCVSLPLTAFVVWRTVRSSTSRSAVGVGVGVGARLPWRLGGAVLVLALVGGTLDTSGDTLLLFSAKDGLLSVAGVIAAMYPAATVTLALLRDRERVPVLQTTGLGLAVAALVLVAV